MSNIEKEAREIAEHIYGEPHAELELVVAEALRKKQDRIEVLESALKEIAKDEYYSEDCLHAKLAKKAIGGNRD